MKIVFFDIDGTLYEYGTPILESTKEAIVKLRKNGHKAFICTGRSKITIPEELLSEIEFDGIVASCGTYGEYQGNTIFNKIMSEELVKKAVACMRRFGNMYIIEGTEAVYYDEIAPKEKYEDWYIQEIKRCISDRFLSFKDDFSKLEGAKFSMRLTDEMTDEVLAEAFPEFEILRHTFDIGELVPKGISKATGIADVCQALGVNREDTIAVGDSINDVEMLQYAGVGVVMGNGTEPAKEVADFVTKPIEEGGIYFAMETLGLLD